MASVRSVRAKQLAARVAPVKMARRITAPRPWFTSSEEQPVRGSRAPDPAPKLAFEKIALVKSASLKSAPPAYTCARLALRNEVMRPDSGSRSNRHVERSVKVRGNFGRKLADRLAPWNVQLCWALGGERKRMAGKRAPERSALRKSGFTNEQHLPASASHFLHRSWSVPTLSQTVSSSRAPENTAVNASSKVSLMRKEKDDRLSVAPVKSALTTSVRKGRPLRSRSEQSAIEAPRKLVFDIRAPSKFASVSVSPSNF